MTWFRPWCACMSKLVLVCRHGDVLNGSTSSGSGSLPLHEELSNFVGGSCCSVPDMKHEATAAASARSCMHEDSSIQVATLILACSDDFKCIVLFQPAPATTLARIGHSNKISLCDGMLRQPYLWLLAG